MFYVISRERNEWGTTCYYRRGNMYKKRDSAIKLACKFAESYVFKYGSKVPVWTNNPKLKDIVNDNRINQD